ncbi:MAG: 4'-phosphopantetheinyl transferase family protein [Flavobacteriales bacterium Tduv]
MPVVDSVESDDHTKILVWEVTEPEEVLLKTLELSTEDMKKYTRLTPKRQKEFLGVRCSLKNLGLPLDVRHDAKGKPFLEKGRNISISHAHERVAVASSSHLIGIDIERLKPGKILNLRKKFLRNDETAFIEPKYEVDQLHIFWGIKESLYKLHGGGLPSLLEHYKVNPFSINDSYIKCWIIEDSYSKSFWAHHKKTENYQLIYIIDHE